ncbi:MAG: metal ABC transporter substrate-binding protein [Trueperella sp.]|uniref:metal ABC transporter substrate-binding protein n=1 Tax=Trueperella sp. TaxID=2699835 RepID=UPI0025D91736|nr:metal ABC transporter substrate-binding protein [Trueperella sp.]MCI7305609.1 metal ABC transporter substrate-binding protein [Trueperella sp.]MDY5403038.1 metal ABC transporter substrate-binding protein [Trueperella sp.]
MKLSKIAPLFFAGALALGACSSGSNGAGSPSSVASSSSASSAGALKVTTSFYPLSYLAERIGADHVAITDLTPPGSDAHGVELSPKEVAELSQSDLVLYIAKLSPAIDDAITASGVSAVNIGESVNLLPFDALGTDPHDGEDHDHADHDADHADHDAEAHDHEAHDHEEGDGHDHGTHDPHFWTDPARMILAADTVAEKLAGLDEANRATYEANAKAVKADLQALVDELKGIDATQCRTDSFLVSHKAFSYLALEAGLNQIGIAGFDPEIEPSPARIREIQDIVTEHDINTVFATSDGETKTAKAIGDDLGLKVDVLDPAATQRDPNMDYIDVLKQDISLLRSSMGCS